MSDIFKLFDGSIRAGSGAGTVGQSADSFSEVETENELIAQMSSGSDDVELLIDYSDFSNFVTFNSAESYVTVTADQILNEYPYGGSISERDAFTRSLDGYQKYFLANWPSFIGHLHFNPASGSYIRFDDFGVQDGVSRSSFMNHGGTGSFSIEAWIHTPVLTGSNDVFVVFQKRNDTTGDAYSVFLSGSSIFFQVTSGSVDSAVSGTIPALPAFFSAVCDRVSLAENISLYTATTASFPTLRDNASLNVTGSLFLSSGSFYIASGSVTGKIVRPLSGALDDVRVWSIPRTLAQLTSSYNTKLYAQPGLVAGWSFNDATSGTDASSATIVRDLSGHRLDGRIQNYNAGMRRSGSYAYDRPDPLLTLDDPDVVDYILVAQTSGTVYDRGNRSLIFNLFPEKFSSYDDQSRAVFQNFSLIMARHFDRIKCYVDQFVNLRKISYGDYDQAPDALLEEVGRTFGWDLRSSFADIGGFNYFTGRSVIDGPQRNEGLEISPSDIKNQLWRRVLQNLMYLYKTKGTRESVEAVLRTYGANNGFVRLKEYARRPDARILDTRVESEKSVYSLAFGISGQQVRVISPSSNSPVLGSLDATLGVLTVSGIGTVPSTGTLEMTLGVLTLSADGTIPSTGTLEQTLGVLTLSATGEVTGSELPSAITISPDPGVLF